MLTYVSSEYVPCILARVRPTVHTVPFSVLVGHASPHHLWKGSLDRVQFYLIDEI